MSSTITHRDIKADGSLSDDLSKGLVHIAMTASWCPHCVRFSPKYNAFAKNSTYTQGNTTYIKYRLYTVDCTKDSSLAKLIAKKAGFELVGYPTLVRFVNGKFQGVYKNGDLSEFITFPDAAKYV